MNDFFRYFTEGENSFINTGGVEEAAFITFQLSHILFLLAAIISIVCFVKNLKNINVDKARKIEKTIATYFLIEEALYFIWAGIVAGKGCFAEIVPLHLCAVCIYVSIFGVFFNNNVLKSFIATNGIIAGMLAMIYPANISSIFPIFSYRTINFYMLHIAIVMMSILQLKQIEKIQARYIKSNILIISTIAIIAYFVNLKFNTGFMFINENSSIGIIRMIRENVGASMFLPCVLVLTAGLQYLIATTINKLKSKNMISETKKPAI